MGIAGELVIIAILIFANALFVAAEIALVTIRRSRLQQLVEEGNQGARRVQRLVADPSRFLAVIQLGITFIGFLAAAYAGANLTQVVSAAIDDVAALAAQSETLALLLVTAVLSIVTIIVGELVPKRLALAHPERYALVVSAPVVWLGKLLAPLVWFLTVSTNLISRLLGVRAVDEERLTTEELRILVERGGQQGVIEAEEQQMIGAVLELGEQRVHEVMVPRIAIVAAPSTAPQEELVELIIREGHSRIPIFEETIDNVIGILYAKDLLPYLASRETPQIRSILRTPLFVPESITVDDLLHSFQRRKVHIAIVLDEYGGTAGMVTIEDLIEEIVGEIQDEYDVEEPMIVALSDHEARVDGRLSVDDLADHFDVELDGSERDHYDTVGGLVYHHMAGVPAVGDTVEVDGLTLTVETTDGRRVGKVLVTRKARPAGGGDELAEG